MNRPTIEVPIAHYVAMAPRVWPEIYGRRSGDVDDVQETETDLEGLRAGLKATQEIVSVE